MPNQRTQAIESGTQLHQSQYLILAVERTNGMPNLDDVYRKFGEVSEAAQLLETQLGNLLLAVEASKSDLFFLSREEEACEILNRIDKSTLGQVLRKLSQDSPGFGDSAELFAAALAERNRLSHSFYREHNFRRNSSEGCALMLDDLSAIHETILDAFRVAQVLSGVDLDSLRLREEGPTQHLNLD